MNKVSVYRDLGVVDIKEIELFESQMGYYFPSNYKKLISQHNELRPSNDCFDFQFKGEEDSRDVSFYGYGPNVSSTTSIVRNQQEKDQYYREHLVVIGESANGDYICFLDTDDLWVKNKLEKQLNFLKINNEFKIVYSNYYILNEKKKKNYIKHHQNLPSGFITRELLDYYRSQGMSFWRYIYCKNFALRNFFNFFTKIVIGGDKAGRNYVNFNKHFLQNLIYPNAWLSIIFFVFRRIKKVLKVR